MATTTVVPTLDVVEDRTASIVAGGMAMLNKQYHLAAYNMPENLI